MKIFLLESIVLRPKEVCERLGISYATLREYVKGVGLNRLFLRVVGGGLEKRMSRC